MSVNSVIREISKFDRKAALWLQRKLPLYAKRDPDIIYEAYDPYDVNQLLRWRRTPQGGTYWNLINDFIHIRRVRSLEDRNASYQNYRENYPNTLRW